MAQYIISDAGQEQWSGFGGLNPGRACALKACGGGRGGGPCDRVWKDAGGPLLDEHGPRHGQARCAAYAEVLRSLRAWAAVEEFVAFVTARAVASPVG